MDHNMWIRSDTLGIAHSWPAHARQVYRMLGLRETAHLPREGMSPRLVDGIMVQVLPSMGPMPRRYWKRSTHRVIGQCPMCGRWLSVARLRQHAVSHDRG